MRLDKDGRNTSRSQEINVNSFNEELSSSERTGRLVETEEIQPRSSDDSKSLNVEQTHDKPGRPVATLHTAEAQDSSGVRSSHEGDTFNVDDEVLRKRMEKSIADHDESHEPMYVHHTGTLASSIVSCLKEERKIRNSFCTRWTSFPFPTTSSRKDYLTDIDMVRNRETGNVIRPTS